MVEETYSQYCKLAVSGLVLLSPTLLLPQDEFASWLCEQRKQFDLLA